MAKLVKMGGSGSLGITLPKDKLDERGLEAGDEVGIVTTDDPDVLRIHLPPKQGGVGGYHCLASAETFSTPYFRSMGTSWHDGVGQTSESVAFLIEAPRPALKTADIR